MVTSGCSISPMRARCLEYCWDAASSAWIPSPSSYFIGTLVNGALGYPANCSGGLDYDCDKNVWCMGDALLTGPVIYGVQRVPTGGNTAASSVSTSLLINFGVGKTELGDVEYHHATCEDAGPCPPEDLFANISTGVNDGDGTFIPNGNDDDTWQVISEPVPNGPLPRRRPSYHRIPVGRRARTARGCRQTTRDRTARTSISTVSASTSGFRERS